MARGRPVAGNGRDKLGVSHSERLRQLHLRVPVHALRGGVHDPHECGGVQARPSGDLRLTAASFADVLT